LEDIFAEMTGFMAGYFGQNSGSPANKKVAKKLIFIILASYPEGVFIILGENGD